MELAAAFLVGAAVCALAGYVVWRLFIEKRMEHLRHSAELLWRCKVELRERGFRNQKVHDDILETCELIDPSQNWRGLDAAFVAREEGLSRRAKG